ncbi:hypothetical protein J2Z82_000055 [Virgibacillus litoralis]|uniref:Uncharacterized protein n=1 Tax=Virgibacillus litoralis TaxID=578221 RepID=A0ABS4H9M6_9BACI|nr:hypothetical protein [Virgibacillus litoralis]
MKAKAWKDIWGARASIFSTRLSGSIAGSFSSKVTACITIAANPPVTFKASMRKRSSKSPDAITAL